MTELNEAMGGYAGNAKILSFILREEGIVKIDEEAGPFGKTAYTVRLTPLGERLADHLDKMVDILPDPPSTDRRAPR